ncbi:serine protease inhibitor 28Dc [Nomia melanderi]|uniref:serine protease inhibitor 28Dc n=1 Tax=Nomia melanderi TaxID=2448451 RepID=UPI0013041A17|nr:leukocyte elastase inhibitor [Nomia melanderi]XP_031841858.1 leukocyte elastase inhibitor [Nomia melanderi]
MMFTLMFLGLLACTSGQLIYPDEFELLKTSLGTPESYTIGSQPIVQANAHRPIGAQPIPTVPPPRVQYNPPQGSMRKTITTTPAPMTPPKAYVAENPLQDWTGHVNKIIVTGITKFTLDIDREIYRTRSTSLIEQHDNIVFSPISLTVALALVLAGSAGRTFNEVSRVLGLQSGVDISRNSEIVHQMFGIMLSQLRTKLETSSGPRLDFATAAYVQEGYQILPQFKSISQEVYGNEVINVDFARKGKMAQNIINAWVQQKTMGKIDSILNDVPPPDTTLILLSALYFNGEWNQHFLNGATKRRPFFIEPEKSIEVDMMYNGGQFPFYEDKQLGAKIIGLPYKGSQTSMYVLLPDAKGAKALRSFMNKLTVSDIENLVSNMKNDTCIISLPRMKLSSSLSLRSTLSNLGLSSLFNPATADLSLVSQNQSNVTPSPTTHSTQMGQYQQVSFNSRINKEGTNHVVRRNYFTYQDKSHGYTVQQWATGFSIKKSRKRRESEVKTPMQPKKIEESENSYSVEGSEVNDAKIVNLEENKYRFQRQRVRRQSRPIDQDFINFVKEKNFPVYGLDELRNTPNLVNPHLYASDVLHKVEIDITEKGTVAAAVTGVILERDGSQKRFLANRPFVFFIRHDPTGLILFWGTVNAPTPNY